nr:hypothetical protein [Betaproteobacteria bacterium]
MNPFESTRQASGALPLRPGQSLKRLFLPLILASLAACSEPDKQATGQPAEKAAASAAGGSAQQAMLAEEKPRPVRTMVLGEESVRMAAAVYPGELRARHESRLGFRVAGKLIARQVQAGDRVTAG